VFVEPASAPSGTIRPAVALTGENGATMRRAIIACNIGNFIELYDFTIYGYFAATLGRAFFPSQDATASLLSSFATYGVGFLMRPVGAILIGAYGDKHGRKAALVLTIGVMATATGLTGLLPTYASIGIWAPILLVFCRMLQGFSTGGEWGGAAAFLVEHAPPGRRGLVGSFATFSVHLGLFGGALTATILTNSLIPDFLTAWGWRLPFIVGLLMGPFGYYLRRRVAESPAFKREVVTHAVAASPIRETFAHQRANVLLAICIAVVGTVNTFVFAIFMPSLAVQQFRFDAGSALLCSTIGSVIVTALIPFVGALSDRIGRRGMLIGCGFGHLLLAYPMFVFLERTRDFAGLLVVQAVAAVLLALYSGVLPAILAELFPTRIRYTGLSTAYGLSVTIFGGFAPFFSTFLIKTTGSPIAPAFYIMAAGLVTGVAAVMMRDRSRQQLT
jgi:MFS transporter, MHS family, proline/betaine transporter